MEKINAIILAGDSKKSAIKAGVENKSFLNIGGKWMVEYVVEALRLSPHVAQISIVGASEQLMERLGEKVDYYVEESGDIFDNLEAAMKPFDGDEHVLIATSDIPMIREEIVTDFIRRCRDIEADVCYPIVEKSLNDYKYPGFQRTYVRMKDGVFTGGNIVYVNPKVIRTCAEFARKVIAYRKKPWKISRLLGIRFLLMLFAGMLSISYVEDRIWQLLGIRAAAIISPFPELANDVDKYSDLEMIYKYFLNDNTGKAV